MENGPRPAGRPDECFYCKQPVGEDHKADCVCRQRTVVVRFTVEAVIRLPGFWDEEQIRFRYNGSSWCASNLVEILAEPKCLCPFTTAEFVREATAEDEAAWASD